MHVGIVGAGALGLMAAWRLTRAGVKVTVVEREPTVGGLAMTFAVGGGQLERHYHHIFGSDKRIIKLIDEMGLGDKMIWGRPPTMVRSGGSNFLLNSPQAVLAFPRIPVIDRLRIGMAVAYLKAVPEPAQFEQFTAAEWLQKWMGMPAYRTVWEPQLRNKFGDFADQVSMPWFWARIHDRTMSLGYLRGGFGQLYEALAGKIRDAGGEIRLNAAVKRIDRTENGPVIETGNEVSHFDQVIVTLPTMLFMKAAPALPEPYRARYGASSPHLGAHNVVLGIDLPQPLQNAYWLSICDPGYPFLAFIEHTNFLPPADYSGLRVFYLGNYLPQNDPLFSMSDEDTLTVMLPGLKKLAPDFDPSRIRELTVNRAPFAQPIVTRGYKERQPGFETPWPDVWLANMGQVYPHDRGQNYSLILGEEVADRVLAAQRTPQLSIAR